MYKFKNKTLASACFHHPSYQPNQEFQRLEFLGDKILSYYLSLALHELHPNYSEGQLTTSLANMVNQTVLYKKAHFLRKHIYINCPINHSSLSDCFEAWIAAVHIDSGNSGHLIYKIFSEELRNAQYYSSYKNQLQELSQKHHIQPIYTYEELNDGTFKCSVTIKDKKAFGNGVSKKESSQSAAKNWLALHVYI